MSVFGLLATPMTPTFRSEEGAIRQLEALVGVSVTLVSDVAGSDSVTCVELSWSATGSSCILDGKKWIYVHAVELERGQRALPRFQHENSRLSCHVIEPAPLA
jgi:hypothetical protein